MAKDREKQRAAQRRYYLKKRSDPAFLARMAAYSRSNRAKKLQENPDIYKILHKERWKQLQSTREFLVDRPKPEFCDICGSTEDRIVYDHCHQHGHFRGWICSRCNIVLGAVKDDVTLLTKLIAYLQRTKTSTSRQHALPGL